MTGPQATVPPVQDQAVSEDITWGIDCGNQLTGIQSVTDFTVVLYDPTGAAVTLTDAATLTGTVVSQRIRPNILAVGAQPYRLTLLYTPSGTTNILRLVLQIRCNQS